MKFKLFSGHTKCQINVCYEQYNPETNRIIIYNNSPHTIKAAEITLKNNKNNSFLYKEDRIEKKIGVMIDFFHHPDTNGINFTGELSEVAVKYKEGLFKFSPESERFFKLLK